MLEYNIKVSNKISQEKETIHKKQIIVLNDMIKKIKKIDGMTEKVYNHIRERITEIKYKIEETNFYMQKFYELKGRSRITMPTAFYSIKEDTIYLRGDAYIRPGLIATEVSKQTERIIIQETLYALACNCKDKLGYMTIYRKEKEISKVEGQGLNKAVTMEISHLIMGEKRVNGLPLDYELVLEIIKLLLEVKQEAYIERYFLNIEWYDEEIEKKFNKKEYEEKTLLQLIEEYDKRKKLINFNAKKVIEIIEKAYQNKTKTYQKSEKGKECLGKIEKLKKYFEL